MKRSADKSSSWALRPEYYREKRSSSNFQGAKGEREKEKRKWHQKIEKRLDSLRKEAEELMKAKEELERALAWSVKRRNSEEPARNESRMRIEREGGQNHKIKQSCFWRKWTLWIFKRKDWIKMSHNKKIIRRQPAFFKAPMSKTHFSVVSVVSTTEILGFMVVQKGFTSRNHSFFLNRLHERLTNVLKVDLSKLVLIMDNLKVHHSRFSSITANQKLHILFGAPYSSFANIIEVVFSQRKRRIRCSPLILQNSS